MSHALPRYRRHEEREQDIQRVVRIIDGGSAVARARGTRLIGHRSGEADPMRLRGIPCISRGVSGTSPGTDPLSVVTR